MGSEEAGPRKALAATIGQKKNLPVKGGRMSPMNRTLCYAGRERSVGPEVTAQQPVSRYSFQQCPVGLVFAFKVYSIYTEF
ncbi:hypothetical protein NDU88_000585 [Pleurodeles waltl]|uniref:Uncharacterized protein n=1 Tax=Pleurodeles waltl TaxID=8319 RepID=A0AAV7Q0M4_PLEWA|nr:hypothetical protein NDU88_000585 [Pleurodeles waltl]